MKISGIYKIVNKVNEKYYVGSSNNIYSKRWPEHKRLLRNNIHPNIHLQRAWNKHSPDDFDLVLVERSSQNKLLASEQKYLNIAQIEKEKCYNISFIAGKIEMTKAIRKRISEKKMGNNCRSQPLLKLATNNTKKYLKRIWVKYGKRILTEEAKKKGIGGRFAYYSLIKEFQKDEKAVTKRRENFKHQCKTYIARGERSGRYNPTEYHFKNDFSNEHFDGTQNEFLNKYGYYPHPDFIKRKRKSCKGWRMVISQENNSQD